jgi:hypothetical protein
MNSEIYSVKSVTAAAATSGWFAVMTDLARYAESDASDARLYAGHLAAAEALSLFRFPGGVRPAPTTLSLPGSRPSKQIAANPVGPNGARALFGRQRYAAAQNTAA